MSDFEDLKASLREAHAGFAAAVETIRPALHRYCSRMTGSALDGEDLVQETLAQACYRLTMMRDDVPLRPWLFTIAHHKCVDFLRSKHSFVAVDLDERNEPSVEIDEEIENRNLAALAFSRLVLTLPPRERAAVVLKDVLDLSLPEIAAILETSVGGVKAALHRGRAKLAEAKDAPESSERPSLPADSTDYIEAFNRRDWTGLQSLFASDVQCELVGFAHLTGRATVGGNYLTNYAKLPYGWKFARGAIDGEPVIVCLREKDGVWTVRNAIRIEWHGRHVVRIRDYIHVPYLLAEARMTVDSP